MTNAKNNEGWRCYDAQRASYDQIRDDVIEDADEAGMSPRQQIKLELGLEEMVVNIISYAYEDSGPVWVKAAPEGGLFRLELVDHGKCFDPLAKDRRHTDGIPTADQEEGGYGIFLVKKNFSFVGYQYENMFGAMANHLTMELPLE